MDYNSDLNIFDNGDSPTNVYGENNPKRIDLDQVDKFTPSDFGFTADNIKKSMMFGIKVIDPNTGKELDDSVYDQIIEQAISSVETTLGIVILPRIIPREKHDFYENDFTAYGYIKLLNKPVLQLESYEALFATKRPYSYDPSWWRIYHRTGTVELSPNGLFTGTGQYNALFNGSFNAGLYNQLGNSNFGTYPLTLNSNYAPQAFSVDYVAGMLPPTRKGVNNDYQMPMALQQLILKTAEKEILEIAGDLIIGAGIASIGLNIDGMSQNVDTTQSAMFTGYGARIQLVNEKCAELIDSLKNYYGTDYTTV